MTVKKNVTNLYIYDQSIDWKKAVDRVVVCCRTEQIAQVEADVRLQLENWALENNLTFIDIEYIAGLIHQKEEPSKEYFKCGTCPHYSGPSVDEIRISFTFPEIEDAKLRWLLSYFDPFDENDTFEWTNYYGKYLFYFSSRLLKVSADKEVFYGGGETRRKLIGIPRHYWVASRRMHGCPAFAVCDEAIYKATDRWYGVDPNILVDNARGSAEFIFPELPDPALFF